MGKPEPYCSICGAPCAAVGVFNQPANRWLVDTILLTTGRRNEAGIKLDEYMVPPGRDAHTFVLAPNPAAAKEGQSSVLRLECEPRNSLYFDVPEIKAENVRVFELTPKPENAEDTEDAPDAEDAWMVPEGGSIFLPVHRKCLSIADKFIASQQDNLFSGQAIPVAAITSQITLWEALYRRLKPQDRGFGPQLLEEPHQYFGGDNARNINWEAGDDPKYAELLESSPIDIPNLSECIVRNVEPVPANEASVENSKRQERCFESICGQDHFPWLWDVDAKSLRETLQTRGATGNTTWNWKQLVVKLQSKIIYEPDDKSLHIPLQLRNRHRIWRLLEEARIGDVAEKRKLAQRQFDYAIHCKDTGSVFAAQLAAR